MPFGLKNAPTIFSRVLVAVFKEYIHKFLEVYLDDWIVFGWLLLFQEYDFEVIVKSGRLNAGPNHLSRIETSEEPTNLEEGITDAQLFAVCIADGHFKDIIHFLTTGSALKEYSVQQKKELVVQTTNFSVIVGHLYKMGNDEILRKYVPEFERGQILTEAHGGAAGGHYTRRATT
eukprot:PITA_36123